MLMTIGTIAVGMGLVAAAAIAIDPYGVWRDPRGRNLSVYLSERKAKYFMNQRYVPENFDGLIIGQSSSAVLDVPQIAGIRMYNESLPRGNAVEERILVNQALMKGHYKLAIVLLAPTITCKHSLEDGLDTVSKAEAIGSIHLFVHEAGYLLHSLHIRSFRGDAAPDGQLLGLAAKQAIVERSNPSYFVIDPIAVKEYREMIETLQQSGVKVVYYVPPIYEPYYQLNKKLFQENLEAQISQLPPAPIVDLSIPEYAALRSDRANFDDCWHVSRQGGIRVTALLNQLVPEAPGTLR